MPRSIRLDRMLLPCKTQASTHSSSGSGPSVLVPPTLLGGLMGSGMLSCGSCTLQGTWARVNNGRVCVSARGCTIDMLAQTVLPCSVLAGHRHLQWHVHMNLVLCSTPHDVAVIGLLLALDHASPSIRRAMQLDRMLLPAALTRPSQPASLPWRHRT